MSEERCVQAEAPADRPAQDADVQQQRDLMQALDNRGRDE